MAGRVFDEPRYVDAAVRAATHLCDKMRPDGRLARSAKDGRVGAAGFLDDYAFACAGLIDLFEATFEPRWLREAIALADEVERLFADPAGGWFMTAADHEKLIAREKPAYDGAEPSGTSVALLNALRLATFTSDDRWRAIADRAFAAIAPTLSENPLALTEALLALDYASDEAKEIAIVWPRDAAPTPRAPLLDVVRRTFVPNHALAAASEADAPALGTLIPFIADKTAAGGRATAYVCVRGRCELPVHEPDALAALLRGGGPTRPSRVSSAAGRDTPHWARGRRPGMMGDVVRAGGAVLVIGLTLLSCSDGGGGSGSGGSGAAAGPTRRRGGSGRLNGRNGRGRKRAEAGHLWTARNSPTPPRRFSSRLSSDPAPTPAAGEYPERHLLPHLVHVFTR